MNFARIWIGVSALVNLCTFAATGDPRTIRSTSPLPAVFLENRGQWDPQVLYFLRQPGFDVFCVADGLRLRFSTGDSLFLSVEGASSDVVVRGVDERSERFHFFRGNDPGRWVRDVRAFSEVRYSGIRPGIDLRLRLTEGQLEYDVEMTRESMQSKFELRVEGAERFEVDENTMTVAFGLRHGVLRQSAPRAFGRGVAGGNIDCKTMRTAPDRFAFRLDPAGAVGDGAVVDPVLTFSTFVGGIYPLDRILQAKRGSDGDLYLVGGTNSPDFPVSAGSVQPVHAGGFDDGFVVRLSPDGSNLVWGTFLGGAVSEGLLCVDVATDGSVVVAGGTNSPDYPVTSGSFDTTLNGTYDAMVSKLSADGSSLVYSGYLGGTGINVPAELAQGVALDAAGVAYVVGDTISTDFPKTPGAFDSTFQVREAFITAIDPSGTSILASTYLGGSSHDRAFAVDVTPQGTILVAGDTQSPDLPVTPGAFDTTPALAPAFVAVLDPTLSSVLHCTALGGSGGDTPCGVAFDAFGDVIVAGSSLSFDFPTTPGSFKPGYSGGRDGFVARLDGTLSTLAFGTYLGKGSSEFLRGLTVDAGGRAIVCGSTSSANFPVTPNALDPSFSAGDAFLTQFSRDGSTLLYSSFIGGSSWDDGYSVAAGPGGEVYVAGETHSPDFVATPGAFDTTFDTSSFNTEGFAMGFDLCRGAISHYGQGCLGSGAIVPTLSVSGCPSSGEALTLQVSGAYGGAPLLLALGGGQSAVPIVGSCAAQIFPWNGLAVTAALTGQGAGNGSIEWTAALPVPAPTGIVTLQAFIGDAGALDGVAATAAVAINLVD